MMITSGANESASDNQIYVETVPRSGVKHRITFGGGVFPLWSPNGTEIFYRRPGTGAIEGTQLIRVAIEDPKTFALGPEEVLPIGGFSVFGTYRDYDITRNGQRFLMVFPEDYADPGGAPRRQVNLVGRSPEEIVGLKVRMSTRGIRGIRLGGGDDDISLRLQGPDLDVLQQLGDRLIAQLRGTPGLSNLQHSAEELRQELSIRIDRQRAAALGIDAQEIGRALRPALTGENISDYLEGDRAYDIRLRLPYYEANSPAALGQLILRDGNQ